jgi:hypothetical protein
MGKNKRLHAQIGSKHTAGSHIKKVGRKKGHQGKQASPKSKSSTARNAATKSERFNSKLIAALALRRGEAMGPGEARMCLIVTMRLFEEADLKVDANRKTTQGPSRRRGGDRIRPRP